VRELDDLVDGITVRIVDESSSAEAARELVAELEQIAVSAVSVAHRCRRCGASDHGELVVRLKHAHAKSEVQYAASVSRNDGLMVLAVGRDARIGVDIESITAVAAAPVAPVLLHPAEAAEAAEVERLESHKRTLRLAQLWTAKEAVLKLTGLGLAADPRELEVRFIDGQAFLESWPANIGLDRAPTLKLFELSSAVVGALAVLTL